MSEPPIPSSGRDRNYLERKVFEGVSYSRFGFEPAASLDEDSHGRSRLVVVYGGNLDTRIIDNGGKGARYALDVPRGRCPCSEH